MKYNGFRFHFTKGHACNIGYYWYCYLPGAGFNLYHLNINFLFWVWELEFYHRYAPDAIKYQEISE